MKKKQINDVPADVSAKMKELEELAERYGVSMFAMACTGEVLAHFMTGDWAPIVVGLVTMGRKYGSIRGIVSAAARILNGDLTDDFERVTREMHETWKAKNADYGSSFDDGKKANVKGEALRDTLMDLANYAVMTVMRLDQDKKGDE